MSKKVRSEGAVKSKGLDVVKLVKKAKEMYYEYGDTIVSLSEKLGITDKIMQNKTISEISGILADQDSDTDINKIK